MSELMNSNVTLGSMQSWGGVDKDMFDLILWDLRSYKDSKSIVFGGSPHCSHPEIDKVGRCELCGAFKGNVLDASLDAYSSFVLSLMATSPSKDITIFITPRQINSECELRGVVKAPSFYEYVWINKQGSAFEKLEQKVLYVYFTSKTKKMLPHSKYLINPKMFDVRLINSYGKVLWINPNERDLMVGENIFIVTDRESIYNKLQFSL